MGSFMQFKIQAVIRQHCCLAPWQNREAAPMAGQLLRTCAAACLVVGLLLWNLAAPFNACVGVYTAAASSSSTPLLPCTRV